MRISLQAITVQSGEGRLFENTTWQIEPGQNWAILGPTGAGKSTLARVISRSVPLAHGQVSYHFGDPATPQGRAYLYPNEILTFSAETHRAFLSRYAGYHQARWQSFEGESAPTVADLLAPGDARPEAADAAALPQPDTRIGEVLRLFDLAHLLERRVHQLSHGESRKVFLARLLLRAPKLLILDDALIGLDAVSRQRWLEAIEQLLQTQNPPLLLIGSRPNDLPRGISHLLLVADQRVVAQGERAAVLASAGELVFPEKCPAQPAARPLNGAAKSQNSFSALIVQYAAALDAPADPPAELIRLENISVTYGRTAVLHDLTWTVRQGERWALLGPNGAGKSTLLSLILADNPQAYTNTIHLFGKARGSGESIWEIKRRIGWVSPELQVFFEKNSTCRQVVCSGFFDSVGLYRRCSPAQAETGQAWLHALDLDAQAGQPFAALSTGQQRLALLARALVKQPPLLVLDEPCQGLDAAHRQAFLALIEQLCAQTAVTLIYVSHYQDEIPAAITHELRLEQGQVQKNGKRE